ncbi:MAG: sialidase family protein, partial [Gemmatimonadaceae bacterium]
MRFSPLGTALLAVFVTTACDKSQPTAISPTAPTDIRASQLGASNTMVVNVTNDTTAQNETPLAVNPLNSQNLLTGNNDWNYNDGCGVNASFDGGKSWTKTLPNGFIPGITKYTNDPAVPGTGEYDFGGDPAVAFGSDGTAYFACFGYQATPPYNVVLFLNRSNDGGRTWISDPSSIAHVTVFQGNGVSKGSTGQFADHEAMTVAPDGTIYVTWAQFHGYGSNSPVWVATSTDGGRSFNPAVKVTSGTTRSDQDQRIAVAPNGTAYLTFDNSVQGGKGAAMFVSKSTDRGLTWSTAQRFAVFNNPV